MYKGEKICAVVPAYKEEGHIGIVIKTMPEFVDHIVVVDDGSTDKTSEKALESGDERVVVIKHHKNQGVGSAIITGHKKAIELGAEVSVVMAGDAQMDPKYLTDLLNAVIEQGYDYAKGNRFLKRGHKRGMPRIRILGNILLAFLNKLASGYWNIFDPQNGYTAIRTSVLKELDLDHLAKGYQFENDMLVHLNIVNARVKDVSIPGVYQGQHSKIKLYRFILKTSLFLIKRFFYRIYKKYIFLDLRPFALTFIPGLILFLWGLLYGAYTAYLRYLDPRHLVPSSGTVMLFALPLLMGFQLLIAAFIMDISETPR